MDRKSRPLQLLDKRVMVGEEVPDLVIETATVQVGRLAHEQLLRSPTRESFDEIKDALHEGMSCL
jgi:hypothetical protein